MLKRVLPILLIFMLLFTSTAFAGGNGDKAGGQKVSEPQQIGMQQMQQEKPEYVEPVRMRMRMMSCDCDECMNYNYNHHYYYHWCEDPGCTDGCVQYNHHYYYQWCEDPCCTDGCCYYAYKHAWQWPDEPVAP